MIFLPDGYMTICDAVASVASMYSDIGADFEFDEIVFSFGTRLAAGEFSSVGLNPISGVGHEIPVEYWRTKVAHSTLVQRRLHAFKPENTETPVHIIPLIKYADLKAMFGPTDGQSAMLRENLFKFDETKWNFEIPMNDIGPSLNGTPKPKNRGGRRDKFNWGDFWMEATLHTTQYPLPSHGDLSSLYDHMLNWISENWEEQPDERTIDRKFEEFGVLWYERRKIIKK
jgi:hypothetical protein